MNLESVNTMTTLIAGGTHSWLPPASLSHSSLQDIMSAVNVSANTDTSKVDIRTKDGESCSHLIFISLLSRQEVEELLVELSEVKLFNMQRSHWAPFSPRCGESQWFTYSTNRTVSTHTELHVNVMKPAPLKHLLARWRLLAAERKEKLELFNVRAVKTQDCVLQIYTQRSLKSLIFTDPV